MREEEIRPAKVFDEYLSLAALDARELFDESERVDVDCPACASKPVFWFLKDSFFYNRCDSCYSVFVSPRPSDRQIRRYYTDSRSARFWASDFYVKTAESRRAKVWPEKVLRVDDVCRRWVSGRPTVVDIGGGYGIFAELVGEMVGREVMVVEPSGELASICRSKGLRVVEKFMEDVEKQDLPPSPRVFTSFELLEHLQDPVAFLSRIAAIMEDEDLLVMTSLSSLGVDILSLGDSSKSVSPPHHINFFNPTSVPLLLARAQLDCLEVTTPGKLDLSIMENSLADLDSLFWRSFLELADRGTKEEMQVMLSRIGWSSHLMLVARKRKEAE